MPVKGKKQLKHQVKEVNFGDLDTTCGVYFDERKIGTGTCVETRTVETQTDEFIPEDSSKVGKSYYHMSFVYFTINNKYFFFSYAG